jgi:phage FluMu gp28-like protein
VGGETRYIAAYRIRFASGYRIEALSSRPANIRGLQGIVVVDEAAYHDDVRAVLDAVNALLIWGGKIRIISTHNGSRNPFNILIRETKAEKADYSLHFIPFSDAVKNGLYERVCLIKGSLVDGSKENWLKKIRGSYGTRLAAMKQELDCVPMDSEGSFMSHVLIEGVMRSDIPVIRWAVPLEISASPPEGRRYDVERWCDKTLKPLLEALPPQLRKALGTDIGRRIDATAIWLFMTLGNLVRETQFIIELREAPFAVQQQVLWYVISHCRSFQCGAIDATGIGAAVAEATREKFGGVIQEIMLSREWYRMNMEPYRTAFEQKMVVLPADADVLADHQALEMTNGIAKVPDDHREEGSDGYMRHGDTAVAGALAYYASRQEPVPMEFQSTGDQRVSGGLFGERGLNDGRQQSDIGFGVISGGSDMRGF